MVKVDHRRVARKIETIEPDKTRFDEKMGKFNQNNQLPNPILYGYYSTVVAKARISLTVRKKKK